MLGLGVSGHSFPRPLHIFDNDQSIKLDGVGDAIRVARTDSMLSLTQLTYGVFIQGDSSGLYGTNTLGYIMGNEGGSSGTTLQWRNKRLYAKAYVINPNNPNVIATIEVATESDRFAFDSTSSPFGSENSYSTGENGFNLVVLQFFEGRLSLYVGGGSGYDSGMGNDLYLVGSATAPSGFTTIKYGGVNTLAADFVIGGSITSSGGSLLRTVAMKADQAFFFKEAMDIRVLRTIYNNGVGIDLLNPFEIVGHSDASPYGGTLMEDNLLMYFRMKEEDDTESITIDASGRGNRGNLEGDPEYSPQVPIRVA